jgi:hypothetical protein
MVKLPYFLYVAAVIAVALQASRLLAWFIAWLPWWGWIALSLGLSAWLTLWPENEADMRALKDLPEWKHL